MDALPITEAHHDTDAPRSRPKLSGCCGLCGSYTQQHSTEGQLQEPLHATQSREWKKHAISQVHGVSHACKPPSPKLRGAVMDGLLQVDTTVTFLCS